MAASSSSLKEGSLSAVVQGLGKTSTCSFTCGGTLHSPGAVHLAYSDRNGQWHKVNLPGLQDTDLHRMLEASEVADCGTGHVLKTGNFLCSFQLSDTGILEEIKTRLFCGASVRAELANITVYASPTKNVKTRMNKGDISGTLVVCLPSHFTGGSLITRHNDHQFTYDWSESADDPVQKVRWAAFSGEMDLELLPITRGYCITLNFNLYHCRLTNLDMHLTAPFHSYLKSALDNSTFFPKGGTVGFGCKHSYILEKFNEAENDPVVFLKGSDRMIYSAARSLDLEVTIKPIIKVEECYDIETEDEYDIEVLGDKFEVIAQEGYHRDCGYDTVNWKDLFEEKGYGEPRGITWCIQPTQWTPSIFAPVYEMHPWCSVGLQAPTILIKIPTWSQRSTSEDYPEAKRVKTE